MKKCLIVLVTVLMLSCCSLTTLAKESASYNEDEEVIEKVVNAIKQAVVQAVVESIKQASDLVNGKWDTIEINGLDVRLYGLIVEAVEKEGEIEGYQIAEINYSDDNQYFSIKVEPTVYQEGDTVIANEEESASYNEDEEAGKRAINSIEQASNLVNGNWDAIEINGLYVRLYDSIVQTVEKEGEIEGYQIVEINYSDDNQYFSIKVEPTVYRIKKGDTLTKIASKEGITVDNLLKMNPEITDPNLIYEGNTLRVK